MKALSIKQPWAWAIIHAGKDVENRTWFTHYRGPLLIHASKSYDMKGKQWIKNEFGIRVPAALPRGGIVGQVTLAHCVNGSPSHWFQGPYGFLLEDPKPLPFVPCKGQLMFFEAPEQGVLI